MAAAPTMATTEASCRLGRRRALLVALALCLASYTALLWDGSTLFPTLDRRRLAYLDAAPSSPLKYGRTLIDQNYQSLLRPSGIDGSLFRRQSQEAVGAGGKGYTEETACDDVLLFMPQQFAHNGHGSQLNNYLLAAMIATFTNRAMVILEPPPALNVFKSNSQFGCPPEAWETKLLRAGGEPKKVGWNPDFPNGLSRLVKHPAWLSRQCSVPCQEEYDYERWEALRLENNATEVPIPHEVRCQSDGRERNVVVMGGPQVRDYFWSRYREMMIDRAQPPSLPAAEWALRLGAAPHEARIFGSLAERKDVWDYASALMAKSGILRFQPWIARDAEVFVQQMGLPLDVPYDAIHVRRGDKLEADARSHVRKYWDALGLYDEATGSLPKSYIPFVHYLGQFDDLPCHDEPRLVYVATDDPVEVRSEIAELPKDDLGHTLLEGGCHRFHFVFSPFDADVGFHLDTGPSKGDCEDRYARNIASIADLMVLAKSDVFVGEFNSNWGRLVRTFRLRMNDSAKVMNGARPVLQREMRVAWGHRHPGPPGW